MICWGEAPNARPWNPRRRRATGLFRRLARLHRRQLLRVRPPPEQGEVEWNRDALRVPTSSARPSRAARVKRREAKPSLEAREHDGAQTFPRQRWTPEGASRGGCRGSMAKPRQRGRRRRRRPTQGLGSASAISPSMSAISANRWCAVSVHPFLRRHAGVWPNVTRSSSNASPPIFTIMTVSYSINPGTIVRPLCTALRHDRAMGAFGDAEQSEGKERRRIFADAE